MTTKSNTVRTVLLSAALVGVVIISWFVLAETPKPIPCQEQPFTYTLEWDRGYSRFFVWERRSCDYQSRILGSGLTEDSARFDARQKMNLPPSWKREIETP